MSTSWWSAPNTEHEKKILRDAGVVPHPDFRTDHAQHEKMLPNHPLMREAFRGSDDTFWHQLMATTNSVLPIKSVHDRWNIRLKDGLSYDTLGSTLSTIYHLRLLVQLMGCRRVLEVGTFVGVTTMFLAEVIGDGVVTTVEIGAEFADIARENIRANGMAKRVELIHGDINEVVPDMRRRARRFDLIFLDGSKQDYGRLLWPLIDILEPGGLLFVDNVFLHGEALNDEATTEKGRGVVDLLDQAHDLPFPMVILPCGDGHLMLLKPR